MPHRSVSLNRHFFEQRMVHRELVGQLGAVITQIAFATKRLSLEVSRAALAGRTGAAGASNATGDVQKKLDVYSNEILIDALSGLGIVAAVASEELDHVHILDNTVGAPYVLVTDPLDGSSNTDNSGSVGTIWGIYDAAAPESRGVIKKIETEDAMASIKNGMPVAAGYVLYGSGTIFVYTIGDGVHGFTLDRELGEFLLTHPNIRCPEKGKIYAANVSRQHDWDPRLQKFLQALTDPKPNKYRSGQKAYSLRYSGALVADLHRTLLEGGIFLYPSDSESKNGKLRQVYECAPLAFVVENAGGRASSGSVRVLDTPVHTLHQRSPLFIGSASEVALCEQFLSGEAG
ncbi:MAG: fructose-1,6-bisphosphatase [Planctomycetes bacterium]|nr:fructose-1,6-bisphosphatase [Planctomycetota bacterium]